MSTKQNISTAAVVLILIAAVTGNAAAVTMTVANATGYTGETIQVQITVDDPVGIAGAAFTLLYDPSLISVSVESTFFDTFANQFSGTPAEGTDSVTIGDETYYQPMITNEIPTGRRVAAARALAETDAANTMLFTLNVSLVGNCTPPQIQIPIALTATVLNNTDAGYAPEGETIPMLVGADPSVADLTDPAAFPIILDPPKGIGGTQNGVVTFLCDLNLDTDGDGLPDWWEVKYSQLYPTADNLDRTKSDSDGDGTPDGDEDFDGDGSTNSDEYNNDTNPFGSAAIALKKGFNMISIPDVSQNPELKEWVPSFGNASEIEKIRVYDAEQEKFLSFLPGDSNNPSFELKGGEGLIVHARQDKELVFDLTRCAALNLKSGFNLIGIGCSAPGYSAFQLLSALGAENASGVQRYVPEKGAFETADFDGAGQHVGIDFPIVPGEGYFLFMKQEVSGFNP
jgi:hypothetical protein